jgi:ubiquitin-conjugating enzyme E2 Z
MTEAQQLINTESIKRLLKDIRQIIKHPLTDNGIYYSHDETDITKGYAMIVGPSDTPYFGGYYFFIFNYPTDYPFSPPQVTYMTNDGSTRFNPNLYKTGKVCVSILNTWSGDKWSACQTINSVLLTLCSLLNDAPLENEPGHTKASKDFMPYQKSIEFKNIDFAICDMILHSKIPYQFQLFYPFIKENFNNNYERLITFVQSKSTGESVEIVAIYNMNTHIDYTKLTNKLVITKEFIDSQK